MATAKLTVPILLEWKDIEAYMAQHDIVEVVRCKDCWRRNTEYCPMVNDECYPPELPDDWFCKGGERRDDGG